MINKLLIILLTFFITQNLFAYKNQNLDKTIRVELTQKEKDWIKSHPSIVLGSDKEWAPYITVNKDGEISGYDKDILDLVNQYTGTNFKLYAGKWKDVLVKAKNLEIDGLSTSVVHKEREKYFNFTKPYISVERLLVVANNNPKNINSINDLSSKKLAYLEHNLFEEKLALRFKDSTLVPLKSLKDIINKLILGEVDAVIGSHALLLLANNSNLPYLKIVDFIPNSTMNLVFSIRKDYPEAISILNKGLNAINKRDKISLENHWFSGKVYEKDLVRKENFNLNFTKEEKLYLELHPVLKVQNLKTFPPFNFYENDEVKGYSVDYMKLMAKYMNVKMDFISGKTWKEYLSMLKNGSIDIIPHVAITEDRKNFISYTNFNHIEYTTGMAINKNKDFKSMEDLKDKIIAVSSKTFLHTHLRKEFPNQKLITPASTSKALEAVSLGNADAVIGSLPTLDYLIQKNWFTNIKIVHLSGLKRPLKTALPMGVSKDNIILKTILEKVNSALPQNEIIKLKEKWMKVSELKNSADILNDEEKNFLNKKKTIKICVLPDWLPFEQIDENGKHKGIGADIMEIISEKINTEIELVPTKEWSSSLENIRNRKCDILPVAMDVPSRRDSMNFTKPFVSEPFVIATKVDELFIKDASSIGKRKIGIVKSYAFAEVLKKNNPEIEIVDVKNAKDGLEKVQAGKIFGYVDIMAAVGYNIQKHSFVDLKIAGKLEHNITLSIASRNDEPLLNSIMQKSLNTISKESFRKIVGKWIEIKVQQDFDYRKLLYTIAVFVVIILLILYKNRSINLINKKLKKAYKELNEQQKMINKYVLIINTDLNGVIVDVNEAYCNAIGFKKEELLDKTHKIIRHPDTSHELIKDMWDTIILDKPWVGELKNLTKNKETKIFNLFIEPMFQDGKKIGYHSISEDITSKKIAQSLSQSQQSLLSLFDKGDSVLFKWKNNNSMEVEYVSKSIYELTGYTQEDFISRKVIFSDCIHKEDVEVVLHNIKKTLERQHNYFKHKPYRIFTKDGLEKWVLDYTVTQKDANGINHFLGYISDITHHIIDQENIAQQSKMASLGEMIGNIAHQWRQPLSLISSVATGSSLQKDMGVLSDVAFKDNMNLINENVQYLSKTIDDFRNFIKGDRKLAKFNLSENINSFLNLVHASIVNYNIQVIEECDKNIEIESYANDMIQSLINIFNNSKDALIELPEEERYFFINTKILDEKVVIVLKDNAGGIDVNIINKVFEPYTTTKHQSQGTGLGLNITYNFIVSGMGGNISVKNSSFSYNSKNYIGAEFTIILAKS